MQKKNRLNSIVRLEEKAQRTNVNYESLGNPFSTERIRRAVNR